MPFRGGRIRFEPGTAALTPESDAALRIVLAELQRFGRTEEERAANRRAELVRADGSLRPAVLVRSPVAA